MNLMGMQLKNVMCLLLTLLILGLGIIFLVAYDELRKLKEDLNNSNTSYDTDAMKQLEMMTLITGIIAVVIGGLMLVADIASFIFVDKNNWFFVKKRRSYRRSGRRSTSRRR